MTDGSAPTPEIPADFADDEIAVGLLRRVAELSRELDEQRLWEVGQDRARTYIELKARGLDRHQIAAATGTVSARAVDWAIRTYRLARISELVTVVLAAQETAPTADVDDLASEAVQRYIREAKHNADRLVLGKVTKAVRAVVDGANKRLRATAS